MNRAERRRQARKGGLPPGARPVRPPQVDARFMAAVDVVRRTGASEIQIRYQDDEQPTVWVACAKHFQVGGVPVVEGTPGAALAWEAAGGMSPYRAVYRLAESLIDGGYCAHCKRGSGIADELGDMPLSEAICWYQWDPELETFRRSCEGETSKKEDDDG